MMNKFHQFHMVTMSPWPLLTSLGGGVMTMKMAICMGKNSIVKTTKMMVVTMIMSMLWWLDVIKESKKEGEHQMSVSSGLKMGMLLFITSEVMFFFSFFWSYFHSSMSPTTEMGQMWPPKMVNSFNPVNVPLLNTLVLISSGVSVTWSHHSISKNNYKKAANSLAITCVLGLYFTYLQYLEYSQAEFSMADSSYGSIFFMSTGFHGIHVIIGTMFLMTSLMGIKTMSVSKTHHNSFEMAAWYWHFVDVVWLALYLSVYWWGK